MKKRNSVSTKDCSLEAGIKNVKVHLQFCGVRPPSNTAHQIPFPQLQLEFQSFIKNTTFNLTG